jgi:ABC-type branched-subunit amino acid transport system substrate-binding protein
MVLRDKVNFLISHNEPPPMHIGTAKIANQYKIPQVIGSSVMEPWLEMRSGASPSWNYTWATGFAIATPAPAGDFRAKPGYTVLGTWFDVLGQYANQTNKKVGLFASNDPDGLVWYEIFGGALKENGFEPIGSDKKLGLFPMETTDYSSIINEWKNNNCDILWGNCPSPNFATLYRQARSMGLKPKIVMVGRAPLYYTDVKSWGGDLPNGVGVETFWDPAIKDCPGIGDTTPQSLFERWTKEKNQPLNFGIAWGYMSAQTLIDAIQRAGSLDGDKVNQALAATDMKTMMGRVKYDENQFSRIPVFFGQWFKTNTPYGWELKIVYSNFDSLPATGKFQFPIP